MAKKFDFYWADLSRIIKDLDDERTTGPDWDRVQRKAVDLVALAKAARASQVQGVVPGDEPAKSRRWWFLGR